MIATKRGEVSKSHITNAPGATHRYSSGRRIHSGHFVPRVLEMDGVPTGPRSKVKHGTCSQTQGMLFPLRPGLVREEELFWLQVCGPNRTVVALQHELCPRPSLKVI